MSTPEVRCWACQQGPGILLLCSSHVSCSGVVVLQRSTDHICGPRQEAESVWEVGPETVAAVVRALRPEEDDIVQARFLREADWLCGDSSGPH